LNMTFLDPRLHVDFHTVFGHLNDVTQYSYFKRPVYIVWNHSVEWVVVGVSYWARFPIVTATHLLTVFWPNRAWNPPTLMSGEYSDFYVG
jgi:tetrahydromethanopterin S-methyltransferase subunit E